MEAEASVIGGVAAVGPGARSARRNPSGRSPSAGAAGVSRRARLRPSRMSFMPLTPSRIAKALPCLVGKTRARFPALGGRTPLRERLIVPWGKGQSCPLGQGIAFHWRRLEFPTTFPFARTSLMKPARKLRPSGIRRRHGAMDDTTIQQEAAQRRPGRGQERRRASPPSSGRRSIDRTAAKATSGEGEGKGWERPGGNRMPRGTARQAEANRAATCARVSGKGRGREDKTSTSEQSANVGPLRTQGLILFAGHQDVGPGWS